MGSLKSFMNQKQREPNKSIPKDIKEFLKYDSYSGDIIWSKRPHIRSSVKVGNLAGCICNDGYMQITFRKKIYKYHRIAWFLFYNDDPREYTIDHINGIRSDNRIINLRKIQSRDQSLNLGKLGYHWRKDRNCFVSMCRHNDKLKNIGHSYCPLIARILYVEHHNKNFPHMKIEDMIPRNSKIIGRPDMDTEK